jgi:hypothetical protein
LFDDANEHAASVDAWLLAAKRLPSATVHDAFERAFDALCARARVALGNVTVSAINDRVIERTHERFPWFWPSADASPGALRKAVRFVLVEFLTVVAHLTGGILTRPLHETLWRVPVSLEGIERSCTRRRSLALTEATSVS